MGKFSKKRKKRRSYSCGRASDWHHFLFQRRNWQQEYAKALREDIYSGSYIPVVLHRELHRQIKDVPVPDRMTLKDAYITLYHKKRVGELSEDDSIATKLAFLIDLFGEDSPTGRVLKRERAILLNETPL